MALARADTRAPFTVRKFLLSRSLANVDRFGLLQGRQWYCEIRALEARPWTWLLSSGQTAMQGLRAHFPAAAD